VKADKAPELIDGLVRGKFAGGMMARIDQEEFLLDNARKRLWHSQGCVSAC